LIAINHDSPKASSRLRDLYSTNGHFCSPGLELNDRNCVGIQLRRLPTVVARVRSVFRSCGIFGGRNKTRADFLTALLFLLPIFILKNFSQTITPLVTGLSNGILYHPIVAYLLKARTVEPEKQPLLVNGSETTFVSRQWPGNRQRNDVCCYAQHS
jgi:hypothetical protein